MDENYGFDNGVGLSEREARVLARLNARKNRKTAQPLSKQSPNINGHHEPTDVQTISEPLRKHYVNQDEDHEANKTRLEDSNAPPKKKKKRKSIMDAIMDGDIEVEVPEDVETEPPVVEPPPVEPAEAEPEPTGAGFTVLEEFKSDKSHKVFRVLPVWLAKPSVISCDLKNNKIPIEDLKGLEKFLVDALKRNKIKHFFPVQQQVIPWLLESQQQLFRPNDICVSAPTGSGKTLAFVLPTIQALSKQSVRRLRCLAVLPVHDLAVQVYRVYSSFCTGTNLQVTLLAGQTSYFEEQKLLVRKTKAGQYVSVPDIVVCTPGRLVDHLQRTTGFSLTSLRYLIIDEADRIMEEEHNDLLSHIDKAINTNPEPLVAQKLSRPWDNYVQKLLFSATLSQDPEKLTRLGLFQPKLFTSVVSVDSLSESTPSHHFIGKYTTPAELTEHVFECPSSLKPLAVYHILKKFKYRPALCFTTSKDATHRLCQLLKQMGDLKVAECSSEISKTARQKLLKEFTNNKYDLLVCTDAVSRGMDLGVVDCVISYDAPKYVKNYIHRVGRAARAGRPGTAITILIDSEVRRFRKLIDTAEKKTVTPLDMHVTELESYEEQFRTALENLKAVVQHEKEAKILESKRARQKTGVFRKSGKGSVISSKIGKRKGKPATKQPAKTISSK